MALATVGQKFPRFEKTSVVSLEKGKEFQTLSNDVHEKDGKWLVIFFSQKRFHVCLPDRNC